MEEKEFQHQVRILIDSILGDGAWRRSPTELVEVLKLSTNRETLRKILHEGYAPKEATQEAILKALNQLSIPNELFNKNKTRDELIRLLEISGEIETSRNQPDLKECDFLLVPSNLGVSTTYLYRCLDDEESTDAKLIKHAIETASQLKAQGAVGEAIVITHRCPEQFQSVKGVEVRNYYSFVGRHIRFDQIREKLQRKLEQRKIDGGRYVRVGGSVRVSSGSPVAKSDVLESTLSFLNASGQSRLVSVLGGYGTGKTSLILSLANTLRVEADTTWAFPIYINAAELTANGIANQLNRHIAEWLSSAGDSAPPIRLIQHLISAGRCWLFVDGVDESYSLREKAAFAELLSELRKLAGAEGRVVIGCRKESFATEAEESELLQEMAQSELGFSETLIVKMDQMRDDLWQTAIRLRFGDGNEEKKRSEKLIGNILAKPALKNLARRPVFMHIIADSGTIPLNEDGTKISGLFEAYVSKWSAEESKRASVEDLRAQDRLKVTSLLAVLSAKFGNRTRGFTIEELEAAAQNELQEAFVSSNVREFAREAQIAMFLERTSDGRFCFTHQPLMEYFLARRFRDEIIGVKGSKLRSHWAPLYLGQVKLGREDALFTHFLKELLEDQKGISNAPD